MIESLSYSSINLYLTCAEAWRRKYLLKEPSRSSPALLFGSSFHSTIEARIIANANNELSQALPELWSKNWANKLESDGSSVDWGADEPIEHHNEGLRMFSDPGVIKTVNSIVPLRDDKGLFVERKVELRVPGVPISIVGYIDIVTSDGVPSDFKTSAMSWSDGKAQSEIQPLFYLATLNQLGMTVPKLTFRHFVFTKTKQPKVQVIEHRHTWDEIFWLFELIQSVWKSIEAEAFPINPTGWLCSPKYCSYWQQCRGRGQ